MRRSRAKLVDSFEVDPTTVECPSCFAWIGWACGDAPCEGYHRKRVRAAMRLLVVAIVMLVGCFHAPIDPVTNVAPIAPRTRPCPVLTKVQTVYVEYVLRLWAPCITKSPPSAPMPTGDESIDAHRREDHRRALVTWSSLWFEVCSKP